jgi:aspartyl-tRNA(Asn)/glutamyl-tRNA(Gln) amidotransferase subunit C
MVSKEEVKHIAKLARLDLSENEIQKMKKDLSEILDYFNLLQRASSVEIPNYKIKNQNLRKDEVISSHNIADELIGAAPEKKDDYIKVKNIL